MPFLTAYASALSVDAAGVVAAVLVVMAACTLLGSLIGDRVADAGNDTIVGAGLAGGALALWGAAGLSVSLGASVLGVAALGALGLALRRRRLPGGALWRVLVVLAPFVLIAGGALATMWDDFFHWLPNAAYVYRHDHLPLPGGPPSPSQWPSYPYTVPFIAASASWLAGRFLENAGAVANTVFLAGFGAMLADAVSGGRGRGWGMAAGAAVFATVLNPSFNANVLFATYSDVATAVSAATCAYLGARTVEVDEDRRDWAWRFAFAAVALLNLKQANLVIFALVLAGLGLTVLRGGRHRWGKVLALLPRMLVPPLALFVLWRCYVMRCPVQGEMSFRAFTTWNFAVFDQTLAEIARLALESWTFQLLMLAATVGGLLALRRPDSLGKRLLVTAAVTWVGYNAFLLLVYLGAMNEGEAKTAADYWRYGPHIGLLGLTAVLVRVSEVWRVTKRLPRAAWLAAPVVVVLLIPLAGTYSPWNKPWPVHFRQVGRETMELLPDGARVAIHGGHPSDPFGVALRFDISGQALPADRNTRARIVWHGEELPKVMEEVRAGTLTHVILTDRVWPMDWAVRDLGVPPIHRETALFAWQGDHWDKLRSWPLPPNL